MTGNQGRLRGPVRVCLRRGKKSGKSNGTHRAALRGQNTSIIELAPQEPACFDPEVLELLCARIGETRAEAEVARALERISTTVEALPTLGQATDQFLFFITLRSLIRDAELIGMTTLAKASRNALACAGKDHSAAFPATLARLQRVGERSIHAVWELEDMSR